ncbi:MULTISPECIES: dihydroorotase [unclassified Sphingomonas]|uniref:dihydroorotase n=1 Tax=unclassified Sphingomonas TaxID=196159 RepID=UPI0006F80780|nr:MULTISPECIES: dihydroorotase [unclassified Sphingomonas]KQS49739.1 dihydroorotase [Sphingomonas sp. Leaf198]
MTERLTIRRPDDWHVHLRDGAMLEAVARHTARQFARAIIMPNLTPPVTTIVAARAYRDRIMAALGGDVGFTPLMTCYLTDGTDPAEIERGYAEGVFAACKLYPAHATTNSAHGVTDIRALTGVLETLQRIGMPLLIHGEVTDKSIDIFDREAVFVERVLTPLTRDYPGLKIVLEHITTAEAAAFVTEASHPIAATITPQHLLINRNALFDGGLRPHAYCLPVLKRETHRLAVRKAAVSGSPRFFLGTDSAPHVVGAKESGCGCAGIFNAPFALEAYLRVFEEEGAIDKFEAFASEHGARFYGLPLNDGTVTLVRDPVEVPASIGEGATAVVPFLAGTTVGWRFEG